MKCKYERLCQFVSTSRPRLNYRSANNVSILGGGGAVVSGAKGRKGKGKKGKKQKNQPENSFMRKVSYFQKNFDTEPRVHPSFDLT